MVTRSKACMDGGNHALAGAIYSMLYLTTQHGYLNLHSINNNNIIIVMLITRQHRIRNIEMAFKSRV